MHRAPPPPAQQLRKLIIEDLASLVWLAKLSALAAASTLHHVTRPCRLHLRIKRSKPSVIAAFSVGRAFAAGSVRLHAPCPPPPHEYWTMQKEFWFTWGGRSAIVHSSVCGQQMLRGRPRTRRVSGHLGTAASGADLKET